MPCSSSCLLLTIGCSAHNRHVVLTISCGAHISVCFYTRRPKSGGKMVWLDIGGGTARNLEFLTVQTIRDNFEKIMVVDVSPSLLEVARKRVQAAGLSDIIECVHCDFCNANQVAQKLPKAGTADLVTFSYSLSMIPDKTAALKSAAMLLKPNGEGVLGKWIVLIL